MRKYLLALDQGSASSRALVFDHKGRLKARAQVKLPTLTPEPGWVEHRPEQLLSSQLLAAKQVFNQLGSQKKDVVALGIANQRSTILLWDRKTGRPFTPAVSWQDRRASELCRSILHASDKAADMISQKTGLRLTPYYAAPKLAWLLEHIPGARKRAENGDLLCGTVNTYLIWHLTEGKVHVTDHTNAARMLLMNLSPPAGRHGTLSWDTELLNLFGIPAQILPRIASTCENLGEARMGRHRIPIFSSIGDQQAASIGLGCTEEGDITLNYGTGGFLLLNTGTSRISVPGLLTSIGWSSPQKASYLLEGTVNSVGSALDWMRDDLKLFKDYHEAERLYHQSKNPAVIVPALAGLAAPHWREDVQTQFFNMNRQTQRADLVRGLVEGIAFLMMDIFNAMNKANLRLSRRFRAGGGISNLDVLLQFQADLFQTPIERPVTVEATALGAAFLAGLGAGVWSDPQQVQELIKIGRTFKPRLPGQEAEKLHRRWEKLLHLVLRLSSEQ